MRRFLAGALLGGLLWVPLTYAAANLHYGLHLWTQSTHGRPGRLRRALW